MTEPDRPVRKRRTDRERALEELRRARARLAEADKRADAAEDAWERARDAVAPLLARVRHLEADPALAEVDGQTAIDDVLDVPPGKHEHDWTLDGDCTALGCEETIGVPGPDEDTTPDPAVGQDREPYEGTGADGARRSAAVDREEIASLPDAYDPRRRDLALSAARWDAQARRLEALDVAEDACGVHGPWDALRSTPPAWRCRVCRYRTEDRLEALGAIAVEPADVAP